MNKAINLFSPFLEYIRKEKAASVILGINVILALIIANTPLASYYYGILETKIGITISDKTYLTHDILHWINDGLMAIFFFVVGLELKREIIGGELSSPRQALLPIGAAIGGMIVPAIIYALFNAGSETSHGWGIPMATDIAFALGVLHLAGNKIPAAAKVFLAALAIVDDLGAVLVIALFYTSEISTQSLFFGLGCALLMFGCNKLGVRSILVYAILGIGGVWLAFMTSGVHPTIAAVIAAFTIPSDSLIKEDSFISKIKNSLNKFQGIDPRGESPSLKPEQIHLMEQMKNDTNAATPPLQRLEHALHPLVSLFILPLFALANAGVSLDIDVVHLLSTGVVPGVFFGLLIGKLVGVVGASYLLKGLNLAVIPRGVDFKGMVGLGFLAAIGFTMSLFITTLAFTHPEHVDQAKIGIFLASILGGIIGYMMLKGSIGRR
ncbi:MAG: Na+/H+ antiporter NhaA [Saprospiraceae bacterium]|nr:Na+/H+ antiporter NhaA [Saprospiraceae bacterium]